MSSIADRSEPRIAIELDAIVHPERGRTWACTIRDFCGSEGVDDNPVHPSCGSICLCIPLERAIPQKKSQLINQND